MPGPCRSSSMRICGGEVGDLRAEDGERVAAGRVGARDEQRVGHRLGQRAELGQAAAPGARRDVPAATAPRERRDPRQRRLLGSGRLPPGSSPPVAGGAVDERETSSALNEPGSGGSSAPFARCLRLGLVREARALDGGRRVGVVEGRELLPQRAALLGAEAVLEGVEQLGLGELAPAALAEDPADQRGRGEEVGHLPVVGPSGRPIAAYSPGILVGSRRASAMYWLMPAT